MENHINLQAQYAKNAEMLYEAALTLLADPKEGNLIMAAGNFSRAIECQLKRAYLILGGDPYDGGVMESHNLGSIVGQIQQLGGLGRVTQDSRLRQVGAYGFAASYAYSAGLPLPNQATVESFRRYSEDVAKAVELKLQEISTRSAHENRNRKLKGL